MLWTMLLVAAASNSCATDGPIETSVAAILRMPELYSGRCVTLTGWSDGRSLFVTERALRQYHAGDGWPRAGHRGDRMMGVYGLPELPEGPWEAQNTRGLQWRLTGRVDSCADIVERVEGTRRAQDRQPPQEGTLTITMVTGHCHYWTGPVLIVSNGRPQPRP